MLHSPQKNGVESVPYRWVDTPPQLVQMDKALSGALRIAIDSEGDSLYHYREKICLIQFSTDEETFIVDPLALQDLSLLAPVMANPSIEKVFHAAANDLTGLKRDFSFSFAHVFDTQVAAQFLGYEQTGLAALLEQLLGINHPKARQQDDWSRRPLVRAQLEYAARDTHHLLALRDLMEARLRQLGRWTWVQEEFAALPSAEPVRREFDPEGYRRIKGVRALPPGGQGALRALYVLRERYAEALDLPPFKVINNAVLVDLARRPPASISELIDRKGLPSRLISRMAPEILAALRDGQREILSAISPEPREKWRPPTPEYRRRLERLKVWRDVKSRQLSLARGVLFPGTLLEWMAGLPSATLGDLHRNPEIRRWRADLLGEEVVALLADSDAR